MIASTSDNTAYTLRAFAPCPSGHCSLRSQRRICWKPLCDMASDRKDIGKYLYNKKDIYFCIMLVSQLKKERNSYDIRIS